MIYSKKLSQYIPITIKKSAPCNIPQWGIFTQYLVKDGKIPVGKINILDVEKGIKVDYIENMNPQLYSKFGQLADMIEVNHCLERGLTDFEITSNAGLNSHALHYLRGKRFRSEDVENKIKKVIEETPPNEKYNTKFLGQVAMYMPKELIDKYVEQLKKTPLKID